jgi:MFS-type transporter involved in bile tolerance (Atg22 family)
LLASELLLLGTLIGAAWRRKLDQMTLLAGTVALALLGNALICGVLSGPHDRYGARMVWIATLVVVMIQIGNPAAAPSYARAPDQS